MQWSKVSFKWARHESCPGGGQELCTLHPARAPWAGLSDTPEPVMVAEINLGVTLDTVFLPQDCICHPAGAFLGRDGGAKAGGLVGPRLAPRRRRRSYAADRRAAASGGGCRDESLQPRMPPYVSHRHRECRPTPGSFRGSSWWDVPFGSIQPEVQPDVTRAGDGGRVECGGISLFSSTPS
jgi:hypothetical protein